MTIMVVMKWKWNQSSTTITNLDRRAIELTDHSHTARWPKLVRYIDDGRYPIDNNACENAIRGSVRISVFEAGC